MLSQLFNFISHLVILCVSSFFVMRRDAGTSRRSPARSSLTFRSVTPMPDASLWASLARPFPRPLRTSVLFGKYCDSFAPFVDDVGPCIYLNSGMFLALLSHLLCIAYISSLQHWREGRGQGWKAASLQGIRLPSSYPQLCKYWMKGLIGFICLCTCSATDDSINTRNANAESVSKWQLE